MIRIRNPKANPKENEKKKREKEKIKRKVKGKRKGKRGIEIEEKKSKDFRFLICVRSLQILHTDVIDMYASDGRERNNHDGKDRFLYRDFTS